MATQALVNPMHIVNAMPRLRAGEAPAAVLAALLDADPGRSQRQVHIVDAQGRVAQHSGPDCIAWAGTVQGAGVSVAGNMLADPDVVARTLDAFAQARGSLPSAC